MGEEDDAEEDAAPSTDPLAALKSEEEPEQPK